MILPRLHLHSTHTRDMLRSFLVLVLILRCAESACPADWDLIDGRECRGRYTSVHTFYDEAFNLTISKCKEILATPIIIHNQEEQDYWTKRMKSIDEITSPFDVMGGRYEWADGSSLDYRPKEGLYNTDFATDWCDYDNYATLMIGGYWGSAGGSGHEPYTTDIFCTMPVRQPPVPDDGCTGFADDSADGACYQIAKTAASSADAAKVCRNLGASIASVHSDQENAFIRRLAVSQGAIKGVWLGGALTRKGIVLGWVDGTAWDYDNFYPGFPMKGLGGCLMMDTATTTGEWANVDCATNLNVVCMRQRNYLQPSCSSGPWVEGQVIYSPGYPYDASTSCDYILSVDAGKKVELEIQVLEANPCCDHLILYENYFGADEIANLTGIINDGRYTSRTNFMRVSWQPNGGVNVKGVMMTFRGV